MSIPPLDSISELPFPRQTTAAASEAPSEIECTVMSLFDEFRNPILRYVLSFGMALHDGEEVTQEVFLGLFKHLRVGKSRRNLRGWIFRVAHNLALKQRHAIHIARNTMESNWSIAERQFDPSPSPEDEVVSTQRQRRLLAALGALPEVDQRCLRLRAEGLRYREIAEVLGISLGAVSISLTRSLARLMRADRR
jgi:RNA polymerase sigma-70 factor (ECF subfamily)